MPLKPPRPLTWTAIAMGAAVVVYALLVWQRRWISDDGLIVVRTVNQILEGNGPVFNAFERAESNTSTLWTYLVWLIAVVTRGNVITITLITGALLAIGGLLLGMDAARRWQRSRGATGLLVPAGALVVLVVYPFWDYATSGLENGLCHAWLALIWWQLVRLTPQTCARGQLATAIVMGLGPLVRPDFAVASGVFLVAACLLVRPRWPRTLALAGAAIALPVAYEIFRAGYYGVLVPLPALAKNASSALWTRGWTYLYDFNKPYILWIPLVVLVAMLAVALQRRLLGRRDLIVVGAPVVTALLLGLFVTRVGGDFMHGRMLLAPALLIALPAFVLPISRLTAPALIALAGWAMFVGIARHEAKLYHTTVYIEDERKGYMRFTKQRHPTTAEAYIRGEKLPALEVFTAYREGKRRVISEGGLNVPMNAWHPGSVVFVVGRLGTGGIVTPIDGTVGDTLGLANPIGARITPTEPGFPGHEKALPWGWILAEFADAETDSMLHEFQHPTVIKAARHALGCGEIAELLASVREPMSPSRFWKNLTGSLRRTRLVIPANPLEAEEKFCGTPPRLIAFARTSFQYYGWSILNVIDGNTRNVAETSMGYSSGIAFDNHREWVVIQLPKARMVSSVIIHPGASFDEDGESGFPVDFKIQVWDGLRWLDRVTHTNYPVPPANTPQVFRWAKPDFTNQIRVYATKLRELQPNGYLMQVAEIEVP